MENNTMCRTCGMLNDQGACPASDSRTDPHDNRIIERSELRRERQERNAKYERYLSSGRGGTWR